MCHDQSEWEELNEKALSTIQLCLMNNVLQEVLKEKTTMAEGESIRTHISEFVILLNDLKNLKAKISDEYLVMLLLCSLPSSYKTFKETQINGRDHLPIVDVNMYILSKDKLDNELDPSKKSNGQFSILVAKGRQQTRKVGHVKAECWKLQNKIKKDVENDEKAKQKAEVVDTSVVEDRGDDFLLVSMTKSSHLNSEWIINSGCCNNLF
ncbi:hypothetical protein Gotur_021848 [Gossypium turneri]